MVERALKPCPLCAEIPNVEIEGEELPRELQDVVDDLYGLASAPTDPDAAMRFSRYLGNTSSQTHVL